MKRRTYKFDLYVMDATDPEIERIWDAIIEAVEKEKLTLVGGSAPEVKKR